MRVDLLCVKPVLMYKAGQTYPILAGQVQSFINRGFFVRPEDAPKPKRRSKPRKDSGASEGTDKPVATEE